MHPLVPRTFSSHASRNSFPSPYLRETITEGLQTTVPQRLSSSFDEYLEGSHRSCSDGAATKIEGSTNGGRKSFSPYAHTHKPNAKIDICDEEKCEWREEKNRAGMMAAVRQQVQNLCMVWFFYSEMRTFFRASFSLSLSSLSLSSLSLSFSLSLSLSLFISLSLSLSLAPLSLRSPRETRAKERKDPEGQRHRRTE